MRQISSRAPRETFLRQVCRMRRSAWGRGKARGTSGNTSQHNPRRPTLTDEETARIMKSEPFLKFFSSASKLIEVAITEENTLGMENYSEDLTTDDTTKLLSLHRVFSDDKWSKGRSVTSLDWSPRFGELVMSSHGSREAATNEAEGVCIIWNIKYKRETPEYVFTSESPLVSTRFHPLNSQSPFRFSIFHPNLVIGAAYSGQVMLWDNRCTWSPPGSIRLRSNKRSAVQRSRFSPTAHTLPVYSAQVIISTTILVQVVGLQNANNLITVSTDGKLCSWSLDMLTEPVEVMELEYHKPGGSSKTTGLPVYPTCLSFQENDANNFIVGCETGSVYSATR